MRCAKSNSICAFVQKNELSQDDCRCYQNRFGFQEDVERCRNHFLITYLSKDEIFNVLHWRIDVIHYWLIQHDNDFYPDGTKKETHFHLLIQCKNAHSVTGICKWFPKRQNTFSEPVKNLNACLRYLIHLDDKDKSLYSLDDVICSSDNAFCKFRLACEKNDYCNYDEQLILSLISGNIELTDLLKLKPSLVISHYSNISKFVNDVERNDKYMAMIKEKDYYQQQAMYFENQYNKIKAKYDELSEFCNAFEYLKLKRDILDSECEVFF